jgi:hypothetical protein
MSGRRSIIMSHITPIVDDSEMLRAYAETIRLKDAEIERLNDDIAFQNKEIDRLFLRNFKRRKRDEKRAKRGLPPRKYKK